MALHRWIVVADSPFLPATGGGEQEHLGFARAAAAAGMLALLVIPSRAVLDRGPYERAVGSVPVLTTPRKTSPVRLAHPRLPYVVASRPAPRWLARRARSLAPDATGIVVFSYKSHRIGYRLASELGLPAVVRQHNREGVYQRSLAANTRGPRGLALRWDAPRVERDERKLDRASWVLGIADISAADAEARRRAGGRNVVHVPPFAVTAPREPVGVRRRAATVLFLGALDIATNVAAVEWLLTGVWPRVLTADPSAQLVVVGRAPSTGLRQRIAATPRVALHADVPDVTPFLASATVAVNPAVTGAGVNIKLLDYLRAGLPTVTTSLAVTGLPLRPGVDVAVHDDVESFAEAVVKLLADPARAAAIASSGQRRIEAVADPAQSLTRLAQLFAPR